jgi:epoxyqueuosine reductase
MAIHNALGSLGRATLGLAAVHGIRASWLRHVPNLRGTQGFPPPWPELGELRVPEQLLTVPGIWRDTQAEQRAYDEGPQYGFQALHAAVSGPVLRRYGWSFLLPSLPRIHRMGATIRQLVREQPETAPPVVDPQELTVELRREAERLGLSQVGFAPYDAKYTFAEAVLPAAANGSSSPLSFGRERGLDEGSVIVCILEQDWERTQTIPSASAEREVMRTYEAMVERAAGLARLLHAKGFRADLQGPSGAAVSIHYAVQAGLGQLGLNGQLLTPYAGSRCRITVITTNATLVHGAPVDFGIHAICDECQLCVRRCPPGAIPISRSYHRGILKAKIKPDRCFPILARAHGCGICQKVCPVQRYGLEAVHNHLRETGAIIGKGTDELEGYHWIDGRHYGPGEKPRMTEELLHPDGLVIDPKQKVPRMALEDPGADVEELVG